MRQIPWRRTCMAAVVYMCVACLLSNALRVEVTESPETAVPTVPQGREERRNKDRQSPNNHTDTGATNTRINLDGSGVYNPDDLQIGCTELRSKRYISDGFCTSKKPITEVVCAGECLPVDNGLLPFYAEYLKVWSREKTREYRCVNDVVRQKRVHLICDNNEQRTYRIRTVRSCKCKRYNREHNRSQLYDTNNNYNQGARTSKISEREEGRSQSPSQRRRNRNPKENKEAETTERV